MRLSKTALQPTNSLLEDLDLDFETDNIATTVLCEQASKSQKANANGTSRKSLDPCRLEGWLELPSSFGSLYLGEAFQSCISINNTSQSTVLAVHCKVELETARSKVSLYDNSASKFELSPNGRHDVIVRHDVKEVGQHTLVCSVAYTAGNGERRFLPQYFKFASSNPLSVRTKVSVHNVEPKKEGPSSGNAALAAYMRDLQVISPSGGALNLLYKLEVARQPGSSAKGGTPEGAALGKLDIKWRTAFGDVGRLQTQPIVALAASLKEAEVQVVSAPAAVPLETKFEVVLQICNNTERRLRDLTLSCKEGPASKILILGSNTLEVREVSAMGSVKVALSFQGLERGVQKLPEITLQASDLQTVLDTSNLSVQVE